MQTDAAPVVDAVAPDGTKVQDLARITVLKALATESFPVGPNMSNRTTPPAADADDQ